MSSSLADSGIGEALASLSLWVDVLSVDVLSVDVLSP